MQLLARDIPGVELFVTYQHPLSGDRPSPLDVKALTSVFAGWDDDLLRQVGLLPAKSNTIRLCMVAL